MVNDRLHTWFGLSYASFLTLPRVLMQEMPERWQEQMAELLEEYEETFDTSEIGIHGTRVMGIDSNGKFMKMPNQICNYRRPDKEYVNSLKIMRGSGKQQRNS